MFDKRACRQDKIFDVIVLILLVLIFFLSAYPLYFVLIASISDPNFVNRGEVFLIPKGLSLEAYSLVVRDPRILTGYGNTIFYTIFGTLLSVFVTVCAAFPLSRPKKELFGHRLLTWFFLFTMYFNGGLVPTYMQVKNLGLINTRAVMILLGSISVWNLIVCRTYYKNTIPNELWEAASVDGCNVFRFFYSIVLPNSKAIIAIMTLYYAVAQWNEYFRALIYLNKNSLYPLQMILRDLLLAAQAMTIEADPSLLLEMTRQAETMKFAMIVVSSVPVLAIYPFVQKYFVKGVMVGSVKG